MTSIQPQHNRGLVDTIVLIIIALIILAFFNIDVKTIFSAPLVMENIRYTFDIIIVGIGYIVESLIEVLRKAILE